MNGGSERISVKHARTQLQKQRNWALRKASEILSAAGVGSVTIDWKMPFRSVSVNCIVAFSQEQSDSRGVFATEFSRFGLPA